MPPADNSRERAPWFPLSWGLVLLLVGGPAAAEAPSAAGPPAVPPEYGELLGEYTHSSEAPGGGFETRFDYADLYEREDGPELRRAIRRAFLAVDPAGLDPAARTAWAVNAYNFFVIDLVAENFVSQAGDTLRSIADIGHGDFSVFKEKRFPIGGVSYSLNTFERHFLFQDADTTGGKRPPGLDPRLHFVLVCAAVGCPPLQVIPSDPKRQDAHLDLAVRNALRNPAHLWMEPGDPPRIRLSKIFLWYRADFGTDRELRSFLAAHAPASVAKRLGENETILETALEWDWRLNRP